GYRWIAPVTRTAEDPQREQPSPGPHDPAAPHAAAPAHRMLAAGFAASVVIVGLATWLYPRRADEGRAPRVPIAVALLAARPLATDPRLESDARFDSLGRVVYVRAEADAAASELVMVDPASLAERVLWRDEGGLRHPAPSPDGSEVALARHADGGCEVWSVALVDLHRTRLADCAPAVAGGLEWTRDGSALIYSGVATHAGH